MTNMHNSSEINLNAEAVIMEFQNCIERFTSLIDHENALIQENNTNELKLILPFKKQLSEEYERIMLSVDELILSKTLSRDEIAKLSHINREFMRKSAENYAYLETSHEYYQRLLNIILKSFNEMNKNSYTSKGENHFIKANTPLTLSEVF